MQISLWLQESRDALHAALESVYRDQDALIYSWILVRRFANQIHAAIVCDVIYHRPDIYAAGALAEAEFWM